MPTVQYDEIARDNYHHISSSELSNGRLRDYFNGCFQQAIDEKACYPAWACVACIGSGTATAEFGNLPQICPVCGSNRVFEVATFQSRSSIVGNVFESAVLHLLVTRFELPTASTPGNTDTHDIEVTPRVAIETKGSPRQLCGTLTTRLPRSLGPDWSAPTHGRRLKPMLATFAGAT